MKIIGYTVINRSGGLLSELEIKPAAAGAHALDVAFEREYRRSLSVKKLKKANQILKVLQDAFPGQQFHVVQLSRHHGQTIVDLAPGSHQPAWLHSAVASLCNTIAA